MGGKRAGANSGTSSTPQGCTAVAGLYIPPAASSIQGLRGACLPDVPEGEQSSPRRAVGGLLPLHQGLVRPFISATRVWVIALAAGLAWGPTARSQTPPVPVLPPRPPADTDTIRRPAASAIPGLDLPLALNLRIEGKKERDRNLVCTSLEAIQASTVSGCNAGFLPLALQPTVSIKSAGVIADRWHVDIDYDMQRELDASKDRKS